MGVTTNHSFVACGYRRTKQTLREHTDSVNSVVFSPDGGTLASGSADNTIQMWNALTGVHKQNLKGHTDSIRSVAFRPRWEDTR